MKITLKNRLLSLSVVTVTLLSALAVKAMEQSANNTDLATLPEEISITGQQPFRLLEQRVRLAEDAVYDMFNELNSDDRYDIHCLWQAPGGTKIKQRICKPEFLAESEAENAKHYLNGLQGLTYPTPAPVQAEISFHYPRMKEQMLELVQENPEFMEAVSRLNALREDLAERKTVRFTRE